MRPSFWHPPLELSPTEQTIILRIKRAKLFIFLRSHRHELFDDAFQEELATLYAPHLRGRPLANVPEANVTPEVSADLEQQGMKIKELHIDRYVRASTFTSRHLPWIGIGR